MSAAEPGSTAGGKRAEVPDPSRAACLGCLLPLGLALAGAGWLAHGSASRGLDERASRLRSDIAHAQRLMRATRPAVLDARPPGDPSDDAVEAYRALGWFLASPSPSPPPPGVARVSMPASYRNRSPDLPAPPAGSSHEAMLELEVPITDADRLLVAQVSPLGRYLREAASRPRCDWAVDLSAAYPGAPDPWALRCLAILLALCARDEGPLEAARTGLAIASAARDYSRHPDVLPLMIGVRLQTVGLRVVERALRRGLDRAGLLEVAASLDRLEPLDERECVELMNVTLRIELARAAGAFGEGDLGTVDRLELLVDWGAYEETARRSGVLLETPLPGRRALPEHAPDPAASSAAQMARDVATLCPEHVARSNVTRDMLRALVAAHLHRLEAGGWPRGLEEVAARLGAAPRDPFTGRSIRLEPLPDGRLRAWSAGEDLRDGGGLGPDDIVMWSR